ncbi:trigger factor [Pseudoteredinibacter isoporae]|uniref:Trigger factor n=1 Tax=Pseudoteredinibacter isoporae TaxID=570281 RepID=A0A7X0MW24_9GAMM|nr:trigger factor [Pseudoteredinibacter isoporae]MBB6521988.1 trigger factor [Pseudoteredinibacter isoporae]NHO87524.1 trigger factor [Pseudoteredinibacter isoporae]NIB24145.1 trigger factor [Pseudoteredinibacter isoporae]
MQVSIETTTGLERRLTVGVPAEQVDSEVENRLKQAAKTVHLNGFRKGKVPLKVVKQRFGAGVRQEVIGEVMSRSFYEAVQQEGVNPAGQPSIEPKEMGEGKDIEFVATFEVYPEVELADVSSIAVNKPVAEVTDKDIDTMIETLRKQQGTFKNVRRKAVKENRLNIDYVGTKDGEEFEGGKAEGQELVLGSNSMIPGFEDGLIGAKKGEEHVLDLTFPEDYHAEELKGAAVQFTVKVNQVAALELPEMDEEFFKKYGVEDGGEDKFREEVRNNMERELKNAAKNKVKTQVMDGLLDANSVDLPKALVASEIDALRGQMMQQFGGAAENMDLKSILPDDMFNEQAERRVALGLIVGELVKKEELKVDADAVKAMVEEMASTYQDPEEVVNYYYSNRELLAGVESAVLEDQVVDHILEKAKVEEVKSDYEEVIKPAEQA